MTVAEIRVRRSQSVNEIHHSLAPLLRERKKQYTVKKSISTNDLRKQSSTALIDRHKWTGSEHHYRDYDLWDSYWWDRRFYMSPLYWPFSRGPSKRYNYVDPPQALWWHFPGQWAYPRYATSLAQNDQLDTLYHSRWRNPDYDRPWWKSWRYQSMDVPRALELYRKHIVDFTDLERHWLRPSYYARRNWLRDYNPLLAYV